MLDKPKQILYCPVMNKQEKEIIRRFLSMIGKKGGSSKSPKKQKSSRENGKLGGRPPKIKNGG